MAKIAKKEPPVPTICIQEITTSWTKASRGSEGAVKRGRVPEAARLPVDTYPLPNSAEKCPFFLHLLSYSEHTGYEVSSQFLSSDVEANSTTEILNRGGVRVSFNGDKLIALYQWRASLGAPARLTQDSTGTFVPVGHSVMQKALEIEVGQWGRILYNGRHTDWDEGGWSYDQYIFNIGLFVDLQRDVFLTTLPFKTYSKKPFYGNRSFTRIKIRISDKAIVRLRGHQMVRLLCLYPMSAKADNRTFIALDFQSRESRIGPDFDS